MPNIEEIRGKPLPTDVDSLQQILQEVLAYTQRLETKIHMLQYSKYGRKSERYVDPRQGTLFNEPESLADAVKADPSEAEEEEVLEASVATTDMEAPKPRRKQIILDPKLPRERHVHEIKEDERLCECCGEVKAEIGEELREKLDLEPAKLKVRQDVYKKYACTNTNCESKPQQPPATPVALPKIKGTAAVLAFIAVQKYFFGLPLYRQEKFFSGLGVQLSRYVMSQWMIKLSEALRPIYLSLEEQLLSGNYLHMDETTLQVLREEGKPATSQSYMWVRRNGGSRSPPIILFHYASSRSGEVAKNLLEDFSGHLQTDDYAGYGSALSGREDITHLLCWDHTRRYFWEALQAIPKTKRGTTTADQALKLIGKLYRVESRAKGLSDDDRKRIRGSESLPVLKKLKKLCEEKLPDLSNDSPTAKAIKYMLGNWDKLLIYLEDGGLNISNNPAEQVIRPFAIGRKNWLFCNTPSGAEASAILYSIVETAKANELDIFEYLKETLEKLPHIKTTNDLEELLPIKPLVH